MLRNLLYHPATNIFIAVILISTSLMEGWDTFYQDVVAAHTGVHHGVFILGVIMLMRGLVEALESFKRVHEEQR